MLVNDIWGGDPLTSGATPFWEHDLDDGLEMQERAVCTHVITSQHAAPLMVARRERPGRRGDRRRQPSYRGTLFYDLAKAPVIRLALAKRRSCGTTASPRSR